MTINDLPLIEATSLRNLVEAETVLPLNDLSLETTENTNLMWNEIKTFWEQRFQEWEATIHPLMERIQHTVNDGVALLTSEVAQTHYRKALKITGTVLTISAITLLYLGIACYLAGATCRKLLNQPSDITPAETGTLKADQILPAIARLPLTTQEATEEMISKAEVAITQSREMLVPMRRFVEQVANLYHAQLTPETIAISGTSRETSHNSEVSSVQISAIATFSEVPPVIDTTPLATSIDGIVSNTNTTISNKKASATKQRRTTRITSAQTSIPVLTDNAG